MRYRCAISRRAIFSQAVAAGTLFLPGLLAVGQVPCRYEVTAVLPEINCFGSSYPPTLTAVNSKGHVVGYYINCAGHDRAVLWTGGPTWFHLPLPQGVVGSRAYDINDKNEIVGTMHVQSDFVYHAMLYRNGQMIDLSPGAVEAEAYAINNMSQVTGYRINTLSSPLRAFMWADGMSNELNLPIGPSSIGYDIDDEGRVTGWMGIGDYFGSNVFIWHAGTAFDLGVIPGGTGSEGRAIADNGRTVVGTGWIPDASKFGQHRSAFLWHDGKMQDIGVMDGYDESNGRGVSGSAAFGDCDATPSPAAFIHFNGKMRPLHDLIDSVGQRIWLYGADASNSLGQIVADGKFGGVGQGNPAAFLLSPVWAAASDLDADCRTDINDLLLVISEWGKTDSPTDINHDGIVNILDLLIVIQEWSSD